MCLHQLGGGWRFFVFWYIWVQNLVDPHLSGVMLKDKLMCSWLHAERGVHLSTKENAIASCCAETCASCKQHMQTCIAMHLAAPTIVVQTAMLPSACIAAATYCFVMLAASFCSNTLNATPRQDPTQGPTGAHAAGWAATPPELYVPLLMGSNLTTKE